MFLDALERIRTMMASADDVVGNIVRRIAFSASPGRYQDRPIPQPCPAAAT